MTSLWVKAIIIVPWHTYEVAHQPQAVTDLMHQPVSTPSDTSQTCPDVTELKGLAKC